MGNVNWDLIQQILLTAAPIVALIFAWAGLDTWRRQLNGSYDFELSRHLLLSVYKWRDALKSARNPSVSPGESSKDSNNWEASAYENRWKAVAEAFSELRVSTLESEATWDEGFKKEVQDAHKLNVKLMMAIRHYMVSFNNRPKLFTETDEEVIYGDENDEYDKQINDIVDKFEKKIRSKIGRGKRKKLSS